MNEKFRISQNINRIMDEKSLKPRHLKALLLKLGVDISESTLSNYKSESESNVRTPTLDIILCLAKALNVRTGDLLGEDFLLHDEEINNQESEQKIIRACDNKYWYITFEWVDKIAGRIVEHHVYEGSIGDWIEKYTIQNPDTFTLINNVELSESEYKRLKKLI